VSCIERQTAASPGRWRLAAWLSLGLMAGLTGCSLPPAPPPAQTPDASAADRTSAVRPALPKPNEPARPAADARLGPPKPIRNATELRLQAAQRLIAANPGRVYTGEVPQVLLAIPVLEVELNADGSIKKIGVLRKPGQALDTLDLAIAAVRRAAPFGDVTAMPRPWKFSETFLFNDQRLFKPMTLDL
jgi:hypothetical protein